MIDFPASPTENQMFQAPGGPRYVYSNGAWRMSDPGPPGTAQTRNRIVNGAMQISQENGSTILGAANLYPADQWWVSYYQLTNIVYARQAGTTAITPNGTQTSLGTSTQIAQASPGTDHIWQVITFIEGIRVSDFGWGAAGAKQVVLRFCIRAPAGTFSISIINSAGNRSYIAPFTITAGQANAWTTQTLVIPGDTTGTWLTDTGKGLDLRFILAAGSNVAGVAGWQAGSKTGLTGQTNGAAIINNAFQIADVGLYLDPNNTGVPPAWQMPDEAQELAACQRYWYRLSAIVVEGPSLFYTITHPTTMRTSAAIAGGGAGFTLNQNWPEHFTVGQTARNYQTLTLSARM